MSGLIESTSTSLCDGTLYSTLSQTSFREPQQSSLAAYVDQIRLVEVLLLAYLELCM